MGNHLNLSEHQLRLSLASLDFPFEEKDWLNTEKLLDVLAVQRKDASSSRARKLLLLGVALLISVGFFTFIVLKDKFFPQGQETKNIVPVTVDENSVKAQKIFSEIGQLETPEKKPNIKIKSETSLTPIDSVTVQKTVKPEENPITKSSNSESKILTSKKKKKEKNKDSTPKKKKKKSSSDNSKPAQHSSKDDEVIISE
jgi:hypothetical protein